MKTPPTGVAQHLLGFIRGAAHFGARPRDIRAALHERFPRLSTGEVDDLMTGAAHWLPEDRVLN